MYQDKVTQFICDDRTVVQTKAGKLRGFQVNNTYHFYGIKYADAKRFRAPEPVQPWEGVKDALEYGYTCPEPMKGEPWGWFQIPRRKYFTSEDCQYLNVWTQQLDPTAKRPVMVWIHGGGYFGGSGIDLECYDGEALSKRGDVVTITLNHRLNLLGFLNLEAYGEEYKDSANLGIMDLVAALQWVKENIAAFGGDPDNVTLFGQSGGGGKITTLLQTPAADGLFHKAINQSGVLGMKDNDTSAALADEMVKELGLTKETIRAIDEIPYEELAEAAARATRTVIGPDAQPTSWAPVPGKYYLGNPLAVGFRPETAKIPMIVGSNLYEFDGYSPEGDKSTWTEEQIDQTIAAQYGEKAAEVRAAFEEAYPELSPVYAVSVDTRFRYAITHYLAKRYAMAEAPVYSYVFTFESNYTGGILPGHGGELAFGLGNADHNVAMYVDGVTERLQSEMADSWLQFAYTGNPNGKHITTWDAYTDEHHACMNLGRQTMLKEGHDAKLLEILKEIKLHLQVSGC